jgi:cysteinyl-tRNA synthetase
MNITDIDDKIIKKAIQVCLILTVKKKISEKIKLTG